MSGAAIGANFLAAAATQTGANVLVGRHADRRGRGSTLRIILAAAIIVSLALTAAGTQWLLALVVVCAGTVFGAFFAPSMALVTDEAEHAGLELVLVLALLNIAWSSRTARRFHRKRRARERHGDSVPYLLIGALCLVSLALVARLMRTKERLVATGAAPR